MPTAETSASPAELHGDSLPHRVESSTLKPRQVHDVRSGQDAANLDKVAEDEEDLYGACPERKADCLRSSYTGGSTTSLTTHFDITDGWGTAAGKDTVAQASQVEEVEDEEDINEAIPEVDQHTWTEYNEVEKEEAMQNMLVGYRKK